MVNADDLYHINLCACMCVMTWMTYCHICIYTCSCTYTQTCIHASTVHGFLVCMICVGLASACPNNNSMMIIYYYVVYVYVCYTTVHLCVGAFGYFEVTHDITKYCKAKVFSQIGKRTPIAVRFSTVGKLSSDTCTV